MKKVLILISIIVIIFLIWFLLIKPPMPINNLETKIPDFKKKIDDLSKEFKIYLDGLPKAEEVVRIPFEQGLKAMEESKWDEAVENFNVALKKAKRNELVALFNFIGICQFTLGKFTNAMENF